MSECVNAEGYGIDRSEGALRCARQNALAAGVGGRCLWVVSDWGDALGLKADLVVSNPPYVVRAEMAGLDQAVRAHDPALALDGGEDGLKDYRRISAQLPLLLKPGGLAVLELGRGQRDDVSELCAGNGLTVLGCRRDLAGIDRALIVAARP
jgi:release factor glutamine methyltransferase